jgi:twitching motility protein PilT
MRAVLRQAPNVIAVGELKEPETMELALEAAETGHLVLSTLNTMNAQQTVERFVGAFPAAEQPVVRERLARMLRCVICQRLIPRKSDEGRVALFNVLDAGSSVLSRLLEQRTPNSSGSEASHEPGFDIEIEKLVRTGVISSEIALMYATNASALSKKLAASAK